MDKIIEIRIKKRVRDFLKKQVERLGKRRDFSQMKLNPFFLAIMKNQLNIETQEKLAKSLIFEGIVKGLTGVFGMELQKITKEFSDGEPNPGFHLKLNKKNKVYNIIVVSGPSQNSTKVADIHARMVKSKKDYPRTTPILGICYGNEDSLNTFFLKSGLKDEKIIIGRKFWEFISGDKNCRDKILEIIEDEALKFSKSDDNDTIYDTLTKTSEDMAEYLRDMYGNDPKKFWKNFFRDIYI